MDSPMSMWVAFRCCGRPSLADGRRLNGAIKIRQLLGLVAWHRSRRAALKRRERDAQLTTGAFKHRLGVGEIASFEQERRELDAAVGGLECGANLFGAPPGEVAQHALRAARKLGVRR